MNVTRTSVTRTCTERHLMLMLSLLDVLLEMSLEHQLQYAMIIILGFNLHLVQTLQHDVGRSVRDC